MSDEFNGVTRGSDGQVRPAASRTFSSLTEAKRENAQSRIYLGIHWAFDATDGIRTGDAVADYVFKNMLKSNQSWHHHHHGESSTSVSETEGGETLIADRDDRLVASPKKGTRSLIGDSGRQESASNSSYAATNAPSEQVQGSDEVVSELQANAILS
jgi:hypothetical protein